MIRREVTKGKNWVIIVSCVPGHRFLVGFRRGTSYIQPIVFIINVNDIADMSKVGVLLGDALQNCFLMMLSVLYKIICGLHHTASQA